MPFLASSDTRHTQGTHTYKQAKDTYIYLSKIGSFKKNKIKNDSTTKSANLAVNYKGKVASLCLWDKTDYHSAEPASAVLTRPTHRRPSPSLMTKTASYHCICYNGPWG